MLEVHEHNGVTAVKGTVGLADRSMNVYLFLVDGMLIDTGAQSLQQELVPFFQSHDFDVVALTHSHEDHTGTAPWIVRNKQVPVYIHPMSIETCAKPGDYPEYRQMVWGVREGFPALPIEDTIQSRQFTWQAIHTPGHSDDHLVFLNKDTGILFSGDLFVTPKTKLIMRQESVPKTISSLKTVLQYDFQEMFCCHAGHIPDGKKLMQMKLDYLENLCGEVLHLDRQGWTIQKITERLFPQQYELITVSRNEWDSKHIVRSIVEELGTERR